MRLLSLFSTPTPLPGSNNLFSTRADLLASFEAALLRAGQGDHAGAPLLDRFQVAGVVASWWNEIQYDLKTLAAQGFYGLTDDLLTGRVRVGG